MSLAANQRLLRGRYRLTSSLGTDPDGSEIWTGVDSDQAAVLVKTWAFTGAAPNHIDRALWDSTLRVLYRLSSSAGAARSLVLLRDAGVDLDASAFVMVLRAPGQNVVRLNDALRGNAALYPANVDARLGTWRSLQRLADGITLLHRQQILHRNVSPEVVFLDPSGGMDNLRLGGFEWSTRVGMSAGRRPMMTWSQPPEFLGPDPVAYQMETDWYGFGVLAARLLIPLENHASNSAAERLARTVSAVGTQPKQRLSRIERDLLLALLAHNPVDRLDRFEDIHSALEDIVRGLEHAGSTRSDEHLVLAVNTANTALIDATEAVGFQADQADATTPYNPNDPVHKARLLEFLRADLAEQPRLVTVGGQNRFILVGSRLSYWLQQFFDKNRTAETWEVAFCPGPADVRAGAGRMPVDLNGLSLSVRSISEAYDSSVRRCAMNWVRVLPATESAGTLRNRAQKLLDVVRATNQVELLLRDAEIFPYRVLRADVSGYQHRITIVEDDRARPVPSYARVRGGLAGFLRNELAMRKHRWDEVVLSESDTLIVQADDDAFWYVEAVNDDGTISLTRTSDRRVTPPESGNIRTVGMLIGQSRLMQRRAAALSRLVDHSYLLDAMSTPGQVLIDTGVEELPIALPDTEVDVPKRACIEDVLRVRPIYTLQGPPGTGKTTMVAWLIRELLAEDPVAQILVTAQAHGAVDVLRDKVAQDVFAQVEEGSRPISVRLAGEDEDVRGGINDVTSELLERSKVTLDDGRELSPIQAEWLAETERLLAAIDPDEDYTGDETAADFREVVRRAASITYCTTSDRGLEAIARSQQSYDWSIIEEAGKAHSFDLALPLQAGHRWLLIGDHQQLPPYRFESYRDALADLDGVVAALRRLPTRGGGLIDEEWIRQWEDSTTDQKQAFTDLSLRWLETFRMLFEQCEQASGSGDAAPTTDASVGAAAGMLTMQHRMHPDIGTLISDSYYEGKIVNATTGNDGRPLARVLHGLNRPMPIEGRAIVWLDTPWCVENPAWTEERSVPYTNVGEAVALCEFIASLGGRSSADEPLDLALLSPYNHQVKLLRDELRRRELPTGIVAKRHHRRRRDQEDTTEPAFTVDSFQGAQADIVGISLVRNNDQPPGEGLGFLAESSRINVLLSRAERLLVLAGSWDFFAHQVSTVSGDDPAHPLQHWRRVVYTLDESFCSGSAIRIQVA
jgi:DNA polymerase III delta prime subunit